MLHAAASEQVQGLLQRVTLVLEVAHGSIEADPTHASSYVRKIQIRCGRKIAVQCVSCAHVRLLGKKKKDARIA